MITPVFSRVLQLQLPYDRGLDVLALQNRLMQSGTRTGAPDGVYGPMTAAAMRSWTAARRSLRRGSVTSNLYHRLWSLLTHCCLPCICR